MKMHKSYNKFRITKVCGAYSIRHDERNWFATQKDQILVVLVLSVWLVLVLVLFIYLL